MAHKFQIGTKYMTGGKTRVCTVIDHLTTKNSRGEVVRERYVSTHDFCGQTMTDWGVVETTIARGLIAAPKETA